MKRTPGIIVVAIALASCLFAIGCAGEQGSAENAITVSATSQLQVVPDKAAFTVTVAVTPFPKAARSVVADG